VWKSRKEHYDDRFVLQWRLEWTNFVGPCGRYKVGISMPTPERGAQMFNIATVHGQEWPTEWQGEIREVLDIPECPELGTVVEIRPSENATKP